MKNTNLITHAPVISDDDDWHTENMSLEALMAGLVYFGVSNNLISALKDFSLLIGKRVHASHTFQSIFSALHNIINGFLDFITDKIGLERFIIPIKKVVKYLFEPFSYYQHLMEVVEQYTEWIRDQSTLHNPVFRNKVITTAKALKCNTGFLDWIRNNDNKHFIATWNAYNDQLYKMANTYTTSEREEPICIVLDGPPGCGKSVLLNKVVESLKALDHTVYTHTVPPVNTSKDFYDDYLNQDVFVMDDVGQQGKSQWRSIINFVSPVKYPLDCAQADKKNTKFFNSKILICTTNAFEHLCGFTAQDAISTPEALFRRVHLINVARISETSYQGFSQQLIYKKYDYVTSKNWKNELLAHNAQIGRAHV